MKIPKFSLFILVFIFLFSFFGTYFYSNDAYSLHANAILVGPSFNHPLGTDRLGRDILARLMQGGQVSLIIGVGSAFIASFVGLILGSMAGYFRGLVDKTFIVVVDLFLTFPTFFFTACTCKLCKCLSPSSHYNYFYYMLDDNSKAYTLREFQNHISALY